MKKQRGYERLLDNYRRYLADKSSLMNENVMQQSLDILLGKASENVSKCFKTNPNFERGLERLSKAVQNKEKLHKTYALNKICTSMTGHQKRVQNALRGLEKIAKDIMGYNLRKLRENNRLKKAFILQKVVNIADKHYTDVIGQFFSLRHEKGPEDSEYKSFALYLSELFKTKEVSAKNDGYRAIRLESEKNFSANKVALEKMHLVQKKANEQLNTTFNHLLQVVFKEKAKKKKLEKLSKIVDRIMRRKLLDDAYDHIYREVYNGMKKEQAMNDILDRLIYASDQKRRDCLRRLTMNYVDKYNITGVVPCLDNVTGKTGFRGLEEVITIAKRIQTGYSTGDKNILYANMAMKLEALEMRRTSYAFDRINIYSHFILNNLYNVGLNRWKQSNIQSIYDRRLHNSSARISAILNFKKVIKKSNRHQMREIFTEIKAHSLSKRGYRKVHTGVSLLNDIFHKLSKRVLEHPFDVMRNKFTGFKTVIEKVRKRE
jgi:hypothetical protein